MTDATNNATVQITKKPYEILIRFSTAGLIQGAHAQFIERVFVNGELLKETIGDAVPLATEGIGASELLGTATTAALDTATELNARLAQMEDTLRQATLDAATARAEANDAAMHLDQKISEYITLSTQMQELVDKFNRLAAQYEASQAALLEAETALKASQDITN